jgi:hypothetical protein
MVLLSCLASKAKSLRCLHISEPEDYDDGGDVLEVNLSTHRGSCYKALESGQRVQPSAHHADDRSSKLKAIDDQLLQVPE